MDYQGHDFMALYHVQSSDVVLSLSTKGETVMFSVRKPADGKSISFTLNSEDEADMLARMVRNAESVGAANASKRRAVAAR